MKAFFVRFGAPLCVLLVALSWVGAGVPLRADDSPTKMGEPSALFEAGVVRIETVAGETHLFNVELANSPAARRRGLMFRKTLAPDEGMLFDFHVSRPVSMWMRNTYISLDMIFADEEGRIIHIAPDTRPHSEKIISSPQKARYVLEVPAGTAARLGLHPGDKLERIE